MPPLVERDVAAWRAAGPARRARRGPGRAVLLPLPGGDRVSPSRRAIRRKRSSACATGHRCYVGEIYYFKFERLANRPWRLSGKPGRLFLKRMADTPITRRSSSICRNIGSRGLRFRYPVADLSTFGVPPCSAGQRIHLDCSRKFYFVRLLRPRESDRLDLSFTAPGPEGHFKQRRQRLELAAGGPGFSGFAWASAAAGAAGWLCSSPCSWIGLGRHHAGSGMGRAGISLAGERFQLASTGRS